MSVLIVNGARNPKGQTARAADALAEGLKTAGVDCEQVFLPTLSIERCRQCDNQGWGDCRTRGTCVISDDFAALLTRLRAADAVVFATPVYYGDLAESLRAFLERLRRVTWHVAESKTGVQGKKAIALCVAGGGGGGSPPCAASLEKILTISRFDVLDTIPVRRQNLELKLEVLHTTGRWLGTQIRGTTEPA
jgi:multimeric flavodoxin WrbA